MPGFGRHMSNEITSYLLTICMNLKLSDDGQNNNDDTTIHVGRPLLSEKKGRKILVEIYNIILVQSRIFTYRSTICLFHKSTIRLSFVNHSNSSYIGREFNKIIVDIYVDTVLFRFVHNAEKIGIEYFWRCHEMDSFVNTGWLKSYIRTCWNEINMITTPYTITNTNLL